MHKLFTKDVNFPKLVCNITNLVITFSAYVDLIKANYRYFCTLRIGWKSQVLVWIFEF